MKKRLIAILLIVTVLMTLFVGCGKDKDKTNIGSEENNGNAINIACMKGPTGIGMIKLISDSDDGKTSEKYNYSIVGTADEISTALVKGELDIAAVPCNLASVLYNKTGGEIVTVAINTLGVLYLVENGDSVNSVKDLKGKTIYSTGQGTTPEYTLNYLLNKAGIDPDTDVDIQYKSEATEVLAALTLDSDAIAMLPQPFATVAIMNNKDYRIALDVTEEWEKISDNSTVVTGVLVARKSFIENNQDRFAKFMIEYKDSTGYVNSNVEATATLLEKYEIIAKADIAKQAIPYCNVTYIQGGEMKKLAMAYLNVLYNQNPASVGGKLNEEMFYIESK